MVKNKKLLETIRCKKNEVSCENCKHCNLHAYHSGKWYCGSPNVSVFNLPQDIEKCLERGFRLERSSMERLTTRAEVDKCPGIWVKEDFANKGTHTFFNGYDEGYSAINKCADYEDLEEQGLLIRLPCKVKDTLYVLTADSPNGIEETKCQNIVLLSKTKFIVYASCQYDDWGNAKWRFKMTDFGKTVFLTQDEAEEALEENEKRR